MPAALSRFGTLTEFDTLAEFDKVAEYSFSSLPMVELSSSINLPLALLTMILNKESEIKKNKTYKSRSKLGCHENFRPLEYLFKKDLHYKRARLNS